jgi:hypothetical protein
MGRLERKLDADLIARIENGWTPHAQTKPLKKQKPPRRRPTYRAARRNDARGEVWRGIKPTGSVYHPPVRPNRSRKWR